MSAQLPQEDVGARLAFDRGGPGRWAVAPPRWEGEARALPPAHLLRQNLRLPELSQPELVRYYTALSHRNYGVDSGTYPLGSCTMKYNPKVNDLIAGLPGFADTHPLEPDGNVQGTHCASCGTCRTCWARSPACRRSALRPPRAPRGNWPACS